jgi:xanthine/uracil permease
MRLLVFLILGGLLSLVLGICADQNCKICSANINECEECKSSYYLNGICTLCTSQVAHCANCQYNTQTTKVECTGCEKTWALNVTGGNTVCLNCLPTMPLCSKCKVN